MPTDFVIPKPIWVYQQLYLLRPACNYFQLPTLTRQTYLGLGVDYQPSSWLPLAMPIHWMKIKQTIWVHSCDYYPFKQILFAWSFISSKEITTMTSLLDDLNSSVTVILPGGIALHNFRTSQGNLRHVKITLRAYSLFEEKYLNQSHHLQWAFWRSDLPPQLSSSLKSSQRKLVKDHVTIELLSLVIT